METRQLPTRSTTPELNNINATYETFEKSGEALIAFVEKHIQKMNESILFDGSTQPSFFELNRALGSFEGVLLSLIAMYENARIESKSAKEVFDIWFAEKFIEVRDRENLRDTAASKWLSAAEIEKKVIVENRDYYAQLRSNLILQESKESSLRRLIDGWNSYQFILSNLCKNAQSELNASMRSIDNDESMS